MFSNMLIGKNWGYGKIDYVILVSNPLRNCIIVNFAFKEVPIVMYGETFLGNLLELKSNEFDVILGMD